MHNKSEELLQKAKTYMSERRWAHTLGVKDAALALGKFLLPGEDEKIFAASILHDIAKEKSTEEQCELIRQYGIYVSDEDLRTKPAIHAPAGAALIMRDFPDLATDDILSAVANHTLGAPDMSLMDKIIYIADYIEDGRTAAPCIQVRDFIYDNLTADDISYNTRVVNRAIVMAIEFTEQYLKSKGFEMNTRSIDTKMALLALI